MKRRNENSDGNYNSKIPVYFRRFQTKKKYIRHKSVWLILLIDRNSFYV